MTELAVFDTRLSQNTFNYDGFTRPSGTLKKWATRRNVLSTTTLEDVRDELRTLNVQLQPKDVTINLGQCLYDFTDGKAKLTPWGVNRQGQRVFGETLYFTTTGWNQWSKLVGLPRSGGNFIAETVTSIPEIGPKQGTALAMVWAAQKVGKMVLCRTHVYGGRRFIRAVVSTSYGVYDNLMFVQDLLDELGNQRVFRSQMTTNGLMLKLTEMVDDSQLLGNWVDTLNLWNNEAGQGRTKLNDGKMRLSCLNGMGEYQTHSNHHWSHRGSSQRTTDGVAAVANSIRTRKSGMLEEYNRALDIAIGANLDEAFDYAMKMAAGQGLSKSQQAQVTHAMLDETSSDPLTLAGLVDGYTLACQNWEIDEQFKAEQSAVKILRNGLATL